MSRTPSKSARSKSVSCHDENEEEGEENSARRRLFDEIQREAEEELENAERILSGADQITPGGKSPMRESPSRNASRPYSRAASINAVGESLASYHTSQQSRRPTMRDIPDEIQEVSGSRSRAVSAQPGSRAVSMGGVSRGSPSRPGSSPRSRASNVSPPIIIVTEPNDTYNEPANYVELPEGPSYNVTSEEPEDILEECVTSPLKTSTPASRGPTSGVEINSGSRGYGSRIQSPINSRGYGSRAETSPGNRSMTSKTAAIDENLLAPPGSRSRRSSGYYSRSEGSRSTRGTGSNRATPAESCGSRAASQNLEELSQSRSPGMGSQNFEESVAGVQESSPSCMTAAEPLAGCSGLRDMYAKQAPSYLNRLPAGRCAGQRSGLPPITENIDYGTRQSASPFLNNLPTSRYAESAYGIPRTTGDPHASKPYEYSLPSTIYSPMYESPSASPHHHPSTGMQEQRDPQETRKHLCILSSPKNCLPNRKLDDDLDSLPCGPKEQAPKTRKLPAKPTLTSDEINQLIKCESEDVESAWYLMSDSKKLYKKPCPKQEKAQQNVKHMVHGQEKPPTCEKEWPPLADPDPEDISPEVAAAMMFSQELGIKLEACPKDTINHLFPEESRTQQNGKKSTISIVDPNQKDRADMIEKSAGVPSEGVSDSAYSRTMRQKGEDMLSRKSDDLSFALGQEKREYVLVAQKPQRYNNIQFRGNLPTWFPGYFTAFPNQPEGLQMVSSPSKVFQKAWVAANPGNIPKSDLIVLD